MRDSAVVTTYPPLDHAALLGGSKRIIRDPLALRSFIENSEIDEHLLLGFASSGLSDRYEEQSRSLREGKAYLLHLGRGAVYLAARAIERGCRRKGRHVIAVPSYHCGSEIEALVHAGLEPRFYRVRSDLSVDPESYEEAIEGACAAYLTSFFGLPPFVEGHWPPRSGRTESDAVPVIEDAAHALFSRYDDGTPVGAAGAAGVFSIRKSIGGIDGGALRLSSELSPPEPVSSPRRSRSIRSGIRSFLSQVLLDLGATESRVGEWASTAVSHFSRSEKAAAEGDLETVVYGSSESGQGAWKLSGEAILRAAGRASLLTYFVLAGQLPGTVSALRRSNYRRLVFEYELEEFVPPRMRELPEGAVPLFLPVLSTNRRAAVAAFYEAGIRVLEVWPVAHRLADRRFEEELRPLRTRLLALPVHHLLGASALARIGESAREILLGAGRSRTKGKPA